jgi:hypothetical protein
MSWTWGEFGCTCGEARDQDLRTGRVAIYQTAIIALLFNIVDCCATQCKSVIYVSKQSLVYRSIQRHDTSTCMHHVP